MDKNESFLQSLFLECEIENILDNFNRALIDSNGRDYYEIRAAYRDMLIDVFTPKKSEKK